MTERSVSVKLRAEVSDYMAKFSAAGKAASGLADKVDSASGKSKQGLDFMSHAALGVGAAAVAGFGFAVKASMDFDKEMSQLQAASGVSADALGDLREAAIQAGKDTVFSASEAAEAETALAKAGVSASDILGGALTGTVNLAAAGQIGLAEAAETAASAMTQFGLEGKDVSHIADLLAAGAGKAQGGVHDLGMALNQSGLVASQTGLSIEETTGALAAFASAGLIGSDAGTSFKTMLQRLTPQSAEAGELMDSLGLSAYDAQGNFVGLAQYAGNLRAALKNMSQEQRNAALQTLFGSDAVRAAAVLYNEGAKGVARWTDAVNDQGYAQAFASTALNNLSGDLEQLRGSIETALIQSGSKANGIMREMVQTVTTVVNLYNDLPGPVQAGATALLGVGGAVTFLGGAALIFIPKWKAMNVALAETRIGAISARGALLGLGKVTGAAVGVAAVAYGVDALYNATKQTGPSVEDFTADLIAMGSAGSDSASSLLDALSVIADLPMGLVANFTDNLDTALSNLVTGGHADMAADDFQRIGDTLKDAGYSTEQITAMFPAYSEALKNSANQAAVSADGFDAAGNAVTDQAKATEDATEALKAYEDQLHAMADPLFAMNSALAGLKKAQHDATVAVRKHGEDSKAARQANLDLASSALEVKVAAAELATAVANGDVKLSEAKQTLRDWTAQGLITKRQADDISSAFAGLIGKADRLSDLHPHIDVTADTHQAQQAFNHLLDWIKGHHVTVPVTVQPSTGQILPHGLAAGGPVYGPGSGTSDSIPYRLSNREFVVRADGSNLDDAMRFYGRPSMAGTLSGASGGSTGGRSVTYNVVNNYPEPERASDAVPRALREATFVSGSGW